jgi:hypothetical protein
MGRHAMSVWVSSCLLAWSLASQKAQAEPVGAQDWLTLGKTAEHTAYLDRHSWKIDPKKNLAVLLVMDDYQQPQLAANGKRYHSEKSLMVFDCVGKKAAVMAYISYSGSQGSGAVVNSGARDVSYADFEEIAPASIAAALIQLACSRLPAL